MTKSEYTHIILVLGFFFKAFVFRRDEKRTEMERLTIAEAVFGQGAVHWHGKKKTRKMVPWIGIQKNSSCHPTSIQNESLACHIIGGRGGKEDYGTSQVLLQIAEPAHRYLG